MSVPVQAPDDYPASLQPRLYLTIAALEPAEPAPVVLAAAAAERQHRPSVDDRAAAPSLMALADRLVSWVWGEVPDLSLLRRFRIYEVGRDGVFGAVRLFGLVPGIAEVEPVVLEPKTEKLAP